MTARVTNLQVTNTLIGQMFDQRMNIETIRNQLASGTEVDHASDNTGASGTILNLQGLMGRIDRHQERIAASTSLLQTQDTTLTTASDLMIRAKEIATQGANESLSANDRRLLADEVFQIRDQMVSLANTTYLGRYIYGGTLDNTQPFVLDTEYTNNAGTGTDTADRYSYVGNTSTRTVDISDSEQIQVVTPGSDVFAKSIGALEGLGRSLSGYRTTVDGTTGLPDGTGAAYTQPTDFHLQTMDLQGLLNTIDTARTTNLIPERSKVGARLNRLDETGQALANIKTGADASRAAVQDTDTFEAASRYTSLQVSLQALLASGSQINSLSLLNYL